jgi:WhiB family redox-sensing transcriptional regulator
MSIRRRCCFQPAEKGTATKQRQSVRGCPVRPECLDYALADTDLNGIWAGTSEQGRRELRRRSAS